MLPQRGPTTLARVSTSSWAGTSGEVRLSAYAERVRRRWYIVAVCTLVAIAVAMFSGAGGGHESQAQAIVYLGQPIGPGGGVITSSPRASTTTAAQFVA